MPHSRLWPLHKAAISQWFGHVQEYRPKCLDSRWISAAALWWESMERLWLCHNSTIRLYNPRPSLPNRYGPKDTPQSTPSRQTSSQICFLGNQPKEIGAKSGLNKQTPRWGFQAGPPAKWLTMQTPPRLSWRMNIVPLPLPSDAMAIWSLTFTSDSQELGWPWKRWVGMRFSLTPKE